MASWTQWIWVWASSRSWWWSGVLPGMLQFMGAQKSDMTEWLNWTERKELQPLSRPTKETAFPVFTVAGRAGSDLSSHYTAVRVPAEPFLCYFQFCLKLMSLNATKYYNAICVYMLSLLSYVWLVTPWTAAHQAPLSMGFSSQEYSMGCHVLLQGLFPTQGWNACLLRLLNCRQILHCWATG